MSSITNSIPLPLAFWKPAVKQGQVDQISILARTGLVAAVAFSALIRALSRPNPAAALLIYPGVYGVFGLSWLVMSFEDWRARREIYRIAVEFLVKPASDPSYDAASALKLLQSMAENPAALKAYLNHPKTRAEDLDRILEHLLKYPSAYKEKEKLESFQLLVDHAVFKAKHFEKLVNKSNAFNYILYALTKGKFELSEFTPKQQFLLWTSACQEKTLAPLLKKRGIGIDSTNEKGITPLAFAIEQKDINAVCLLLKYGAATPETIKIKEKEVATREYLKDSPLLLAALDQASRPSTPFVCAENDPHTFSLKPPISISHRFNTFEVSHFPIVFQTYIATSAAIILGALTVVKHPIMYFAALGFSSLCGYQFQKQRAADKLNEIALKEFATNYPFHGATKYISGNKTVFEQISDLNKLDDEGMTLWSTLCESKDLNEDQLSNFKRLADKIFAEQKFPYFIQAIRSKKPPFVEYLLEKVKDFSEKQQFECWMELKDRNTLALLKKGGFNINVQDEQGYTPLYRLLKSPFPGQDIIQGLLANGAALNRDHVVEGKTVAELIDKSSNGVQFIISSWEKKQEK